MLRRTFSRTARALSSAQYAQQRGLKVVCVLYEDPVNGYPPNYVKDDLPEIKSYPDGQTTPTPSKVDFQRGELLGCVSGELGLRKFLEDGGHTLVVTSDKDGEGCELDKELVDADVVISQPFFPAYITRERMESAPNLKMAITAGIGSDHVDLEAAMEHKVDVTEVTWCNSISVAEHVVMMILGLVRNYIPSNRWIMKGGWNIADCVERAYDLEGMTVGTVAAGRIGYAVLKRLAPFDVKLCYTDRHRLPKEKEEELGLTYFETPEEMVGHCDVVTLNCPLHSETMEFFNEDMINKCKKGAYIVNTARGKLCDRDAIARACEDGRLGGYAGDVWFPQPPPSDHPWRTMPWQASTPHTSGTTLSAQARYAAGVREILECMIEGKEQRTEYQIVTNGGLAGTGAHSYSGGNTTGGSDKTGGNVK